MSMSVQSTPLSKTSRYTIPGLLAALIVGCANTTTNTTTTVSTGESTPPSATTHRPPSTQSSPDPASQPSETRSNLVLLREGQRWYLKTHRARQRPIPGQLFVAMQPLSNGEGQQGVALFATVGATSESTIFLEVQHICSTLDGSPAGGQQVIPLKTQRDIGKSCGSVS